MIYSVYLISKSGSLLYQKEFNVNESPISKQDENNYLVIASNLHGIHAIASKLTPKNITNNKNKSNSHNSNSKLNTNCNRTGLRMIETEKFNVFIYQSVSGFKIILFTSTLIKEENISRVQTIIYELYGDYVMKNPFYNLEMPIRIKNFDLELDNLICNYKLV